MLHTDTWARYLAHDAPWMESARAVLSPLKSSIIHSHPTVTHMFRQVDTAAESILSFYAPDLPASSRQNSGLPLMDGKDVAIVISAYLLLVALSLLVGRGSTTQAVTQKREKPLLEKMGPVFVCQAIYNIAQVRLLVCSFVFVLQAIYSLAQVLAGLSVYKAPTQICLSSKPSYSAAHVLCWPVRSPPARFRLLSVHVSHSSGCLFVGFMYTR